MTLTSLVLATVLHSAHTSVLAYAGPDQILPLASILGAVIVIGFAVANGWGLGGKR